MVSVYQISISFPIISNPNGWNITPNKSGMITHCCCQILKAAQHSFYQHGDLTPVLVANPPTQRFLPAMAVYIYGGAPQNKEVLSGLMMVLSTRSGYLDLIPTVSYSPEGLVFDKPLNKFVIYFIISNCIRYRISVSISYLYICSIILTPCRNIISHSRHCQSA